MMASCLPPYGRRRFACVVGGTTLVLVALSAAVPAASSGLGAALAVACFVRAVYDLAVDARAPREAAPAPAPATKNPVNDGGGDEEAAVPLPAPPGRLYYLDNVKTILTWIVISHHGTAAYAGSGWNVTIGDYRNAFGAFARAACALNQSYFMCLFFLISGYFTPSSLKRKGRGAFVKDRLRRLALPLNVYAFVLGPCTGGLVSAMKGAKWSYAPDPGPTWFLLWLLIFSLLYAALDDDPNSPYAAGLAGPTWAQLVGWSVPCSAVQAGLVVALPAGFLLMPITFGSLPFDVAFFVAGCLAKQNGWLEDLEKTYGPVRRTLAACAACAASLVGLAYVAFWKLRAVHGLVPPRGDDDFDDDRDSYDRGGMATWQNVVGLCAGVVVLGLFCPLVSVAWLQAGDAYLNVTGRAWRAANGAAYAAYVIHPPFLVAAQYAWLAVLRRLGDRPRWHAGQGDSTTRLASDWRLLAGWAFTLVATHAAVWPAAALLKRAPGLRRIL